MYSNILVAIAPTREHNKIVHPNSRIWRIKSEKFSLIWEYQSYRHLERDWCNMFGAIHSPEAKSVWTNMHTCDFLWACTKASYLETESEREWESESEKQVPSGILSFSCYRCSLVIKDNVILKGVSLKCKKGIEKTKIWQIKTIQSRC